MEYNIRCGAIRWYMSNSISVISRIFVLALSVFEIITITNIDLENLGQGDRVQHAQ